MNTEIRPGTPDEFKMETTVPGYEALRAMIQDRAIGERQILPEVDSLLAAIASLAMENRKQAIVEKFHQALDAGLEPRAISECLLQLALYGGLPLVEELNALLAEIFRARSIEPIEDLLPEEDKEKLFESAREFQRNLHGERQQAGHADPLDEHTAELYSITSHYGYGMVWRRPGLSLRQRLIIAIASFATIGYVDNFLIKFARSAVDHDFSVEEVREVIVQISPYIGFPRALRALTTLRAAFAES